MLLYILCNNILIVQDKRSNRELVCGSIIAMILVICFFQAKDEWDFSHDTINQFAL